MALEKSPKRLKHGSSGVSSTSGPPASSVRHIKHAAPRTYSAQDSRRKIFISPSTPIKSGAKRAVKMISQLAKTCPNVKYISLIGMGRAIDKTLAIGLSLQQQGYPMEVSTGTVVVVDEFEKMDDKSHNEEPEMKPRKVGKVEVKILKVD